MSPAAVTNRQTVLYVSGYCGSVLYVVLYTVCVRVCVGNEWFAQYDAALDPPLLTLRRQSRADRIQRPGDVARP